MKKDNLAALGGVFAGAVLLLAGSASATLAFDPGELLLAPGPSAVAQALGGDAVALSSAPYAAIYNPARMGSAKSFGVGATVGTREFFGDDHDAYFVSATAPVAEFGALGISYYNVKRSDSLTETTPEHPEGGIQYRPRTAELALTVASSAWRGLNVGGQLARIQREDFGPGDESDDSAWMLDLGLAGSWSVPALFGGRVHSGLALFNVTGSDFDPLSAAELAATPLLAGSKELPRTLQVGAAYEVDFGPSRAQDAAAPLTATLSAQYRDVLNQRYRSRAQAGVEFEVFQILALRAGYYRETSDDHIDPARYRDHLSDFTFGAGVRVPVERWLKGADRFELHLDYSDFSAQTVIDAPQAEDNNRAFSATLSYQP